jgi:hypothetical protein
MKQHRIQHQKQDDGRQPLVVFECLNYAAWLGLEVEFVRGLWWLFGTAKGIERFHSPVSLHDRLRALLEQRDERKGNVCQRAI